MRIAALLTILSFTAAVAAPAEACRIQGPATTYFFETPPKDLAPNELVLEVRYASSDRYRTPPFYALGDQVIGNGSETHRLSVVRVISGKFTGDTVLIPVNIFCNSVVTKPPGGTPTGLVVGFATPPSPDWNEAPALVARFRTWSRDEVSGPIAVPVENRLEDPATLSAARTGDPAAMMTLAKSARDPAIRKTWFDRAVAIFRTRAEAGDAPAMVDLGLALRSAQPLDSRLWTQQPATPYPDPAAEWLEQAALHGDVRGMVELADSLDTRSKGIRFPELRAKATEWFAKAGEAGHVCSMGRMAQRHRFGWGAPVDKDKALYWYRKATAAGAIMSPYGYEIEGDAPPGVREPPPLQCPAGP